MGDRCGSGGVEVRFYRDGEIFSTECRGESLGNEIVPRVFFK